MRLPAFALSFVVIVAATTEASADSLPIVTNVAVGGRWHHHTREFEPGYLRERGTLPTASIGGVLAAPFPIFASVQLDMTEGRADYTVSRPDVSERSGKSNDQMFGGELGVGGRIEVESDVYLAEFLGIGVRSWSRTLEAEPAKYRSTWGCALIGTVLEARLAPPTWLVIEATLVPSFLATVTYSNGFLDGQPLADVAMSPPGRLGFRARVGLTHDIGRVRLGVRVAYEYSAFGKSSAVEVQSADGKPIPFPGSKGNYVVWEPETRTHAVSAQLSLGLVF